MSQMQRNRVWPSSECTGEWSRAMEEYGRHSTMDITIQHCRFESGRNSQAMRQPYVTSPCRFCEENEPSSIGDGYGCHFLQEAEKTSDNWEKQSAFILSNRSIHSIPRWMETQANIKLIAVNDFNQTTVNWNFRWVVGWIRRDERFLWIDFLEITWYLEYFGLSICTFFNWSKSPQISSILSIEYGIFFQLKYFEYFSNWLIM